MQVRSFTVVRLRRYPVRTIICAMKTAVIIPVFNESERVFASVHAAQGSELAKAVVVVDDGSSPANHDILSNLDNVTLLTHAHNMGKGEALTTGVTWAKAHDFDSAVFLDGDLIGIQPHHIKELIDPIEEGAVMTIGYLGMRKAFAKKVYAKWGALSGQRGLRLAILDLLTEQDKHGFNMEAALNARLRKHNLHRQITRVALDGVSHIGKREKEDSLPAAMQAYAQTYGTAMLTYARIELESLSKEANSTLTLT